MLEVLPETYPDGPSILRHLQERHHWATSIKSVSSYEWISHSHLHDHLLASQCPEDQALLGHIHSDYTPRHDRARA